MGTKELIKNEKKIKYLHISGMKTAKPHESEVISMLNSGKQNYLVVSVQEHEKTKTDTYCGRLLCDFLSKVVSPECHFPIYQCCLFIHFSTKRAYG